MASVLYISYTGLLEPLGQSQVLQYVRALAASHQMCILSFEKPEALADEGRVRALQAECKAAGISWHPRVWHNRPIGALATAYDLIAGSRHAIRLARARNIGIVHCRSYIAGLIGLAVKRATGVRHIFDMRGFWPDERVDGGVWSKNGLNYKVSKTAERRLFSSTDYIVSLTKAGVREFQKFEYLNDEEKQYSIIPTCVNLELFLSENGTCEKFTLGYVGSVGSWYLFDQVSIVVHRLFEKYPQAKFLVITHSDHRFVRQTLIEAGVDINRVEINSVPFAEVPNEISKMSAAVFFYRPTWSKLATSPTRMAEFLACGKPCLTNSGIGDVAENLEETGTGIVLPKSADQRVDLTNLDTALESLYEMTQEPQMAQRCRGAAEARFSLKAGVAEYDRIYRHLADENVT